MREHLASLVEDFRRHAGETAVVAHRGNRRYATTYGELAELAGRFAAELERRGVAVGERVVLWGENSAEWIGVFFGCLLRGVVVVPLDAVGTAEFAGRVVRDVAPKLLAGDPDLLRAAGMDVASTGVQSMDLSKLQEQMPPEPMFAVRDGVGRQTAFQIVFTSGTTSEPKGIVHTHGNVLASLQPIENEIAKYRKYERWVHPLRFLHTLPLSHVFGQFMGLWIPPVLAAEVHFGEQLHAGRMTELVRRERISVLVAVPRVLQLLRAHLLERFAGLDEKLKQAKGLAIWKRWWRFRAVHRALGWKFWAMISGGAALPGEVESFWNGLGYALIQGYGMTETAALVTLNHPFKIGRGTIGKALPGREVKLSEEGEILVRGAMLAGATWQGGAMHPVENEWFATGDLAEKEASGELKFLGRRGDVIVTGAGMNVHPADLEAAMAKQPGVRACVVVPCETKGGAEPIAVVLFTGSGEELDKAVAEANSGLAEYQRIRRVLQWPEMQFPYTSTGKLLRRKVAEWACATIAGSAAKEGVAAGGDELAKMIAEVTGEAVSSGAEGLRLSEDLHLDSLGKVQLQGLLEQRLGVEMDDDALAGVATLGELRALVKQEAGGTSTEGQGAATVVSRPDDGAAQQPGGRTVEATGKTTGAETAGAETGGAETGGELTPVNKEEAVDKEAVHKAAVEPSYPTWPWSWPVRMLRIGFLELVVRPLVRLLAAPKVRRPAALPAGPVLVIANHVTAYDGALVLYALPGRLRRRMAVMMAGEMLLDFRQGRNQGNALLNLLAPAAYWLLTALFNVFPLPRMRGFRRSFAHAGEAMDRGYSVLLFPEGTRSREGKLLPFRQGVGLLAQESRVPVVPVLLVGLAEAQTLGWFRSGKIEVRVGEAMAAGEGEPAELTARFEEGLRRLGG